MNNVFYKTFQFDKVVPDEGDVEDMFLESLRGISKGVSL
jgi:hypothetical protein